MSTAPDLVRQGFVRFCGFHPRKTEARLTERKVCKSQGGALGWASASPVSVCVLRERETLRTHRSSQTRFLLLSYSDATVRPVGLRRETQRNAWVSALR